MSNVTYFLHLTKLTHYSLYLLLFDMVLCWSVQVQFLVDHGAMTVYSANKNDVKKGLAKRRSRTRAHHHESLTFSQNQNFATDIQNIMLNILTRNQTQSNFCHGHWQVSPRTWMSVYVCLIGLLALPGKQNNASPSILSPKGLHSFLPQK